MTEICPSCGDAYGVGQWPFCRGKGSHGRPSYGIDTDSLVGGPRWVENLGPQPVWVESKTDLKREAAKRGLAWNPDAGARFQGKEPADVRGLHNSSRPPTYREIRK